MSITFHKKLFCRIVAAVFLAGTAGSQKKKAHRNCLGSFALAATLAFAGIFSMAPGTVSAQTLETPKTIKMKLLLISADGKEVILPGIRSVLDQLNVPYDELIAIQDPPTAAKLSDGNGNGNYQGVLLTTGNLGYDAGGGNWQSALSWDQWQTLWRYQAIFAVRQATLYTLPAGAPDNYCMTNPTPPNVPYVTPTDANPLQTQLTAAGKLVFNYLNPNVNLSFSGATTYLAKPGLNITTLLETKNAGNPLVSICKYPADGRENMAITSDGNTELIHTMALGYGVVNWVSKGMFIGERKVYMTAQPDDMMIADNLWSTLYRENSAYYELEYRITGSDYNRAIAWQQRMNAAHLNNAKIKLEMPFNGVGVNGIEYTDGSLLNQIRRNPKPFNWINHTYTHRQLDSNPPWTDATISSPSTPQQPVTRGDVLTELASNDKVAADLVLTSYAKNSMIQPEISGLNNPVFLNAAIEHGIDNILCDTSKPPCGKGKPNTGYYIDPSLLSNPNARLLVIPRFPTNLFYNLSTPTEWVDEYNFIYRNYWLRDLTYTEILEKESAMMLRYMLRYHIYALMFHQTNLRNYNNGKSLLGDLIDKTLTRYNALFALPVESPTQNETAAKVRSRMLFNEADVKGILNVSGPTTSIDLTATKQVSVPLTGVDVINTNGPPPKKEVYGGQTISTVTVPDNQVVTVTGLPKW